jgi:hypothetical protein
LAQLRHQRVRGFRVTFEAQRKADDIRAAGDRTDSKSSEFLIKANPANVMAVGSLPYGQRLAKGLAYERFFLAKLGQGRRHRFLFLKAPIQPSVLPTKVISATLFFTVPDPVVKRSTFREPKNPGENSG